MHDDALRASEAESLKPQAGEMHDLSIGAFRFIAAFLVGLAILLLAGIL